MNSFNFSNMDLDQLETSPNPYTFLPDTHEEKKETASSISSTADFIDRLCGNRKYNPFLFDDAMCLRTAILKDIVRRRTLLQLQKYSKIKVLNLISEPHTFENYIPPPPPLFEEDEILLFDEDDGNKNVK